MVVRVVGNCKVIVWVYRVGYDCILCVVLWVFKIFLGCVLFSVGGGEGVMLVGVDVCGG